MKHFGVSTLMAGCLMWVLLDAAPIDFGNSCKDKKQERYHRPSTLGPSIPFIPRSFPKVITGDVKEMGDKWVELTASFEYDSDYDVKDIAEYGIGYREEGSNDNFKEVASKNLSDKEFTVKLNGLDPHKNYEYRAYIKGTGEVYHGLTLYGDTKQFIIDKSVINDR